MSRYEAPSWPTLWAVPAWIEAHCATPNPFDPGGMFRHYDWQLWIALNHYRVKPGIEPFDENGMPIRGEAFVNRRTQVMAGQKKGKGPEEGTLVCAEALGPVLLAGWAGKDDGYACADHGCGCGWEYDYQPGEPMGMPWPKPLIQLLATSEDQVANAWDPLRMMIDAGPLSDLMTTGEEFIRLNNGGRIDAVTASANSRLGNPITAYFQDETQLYTVQNKMVKTAETMRRGAAAMGGRGMEFTNCYDPAENSVAQRTHTAKAKDIFKFYEPPPADLDWKKKPDRRRIIEINYADSPHVPIEHVMAESEELCETDPAQAERFYGNRIVAGSDAWLDGAAWDDRTQVRDVPEGTSIVLGFDGSKWDDWTGIRAETQDGYQFTPVTDVGPTVWNPLEHGGEVPVAAVNAAVAWLFEYFNVARMYCDPPYWDTQVDEWAAEYGDDKVVAFYTNSPRRMTAAAEHLRVDVLKSDSSFAHDGCEHTRAHVYNARKVQRQGASVYKIAKPGEQSRKIDLAVCSILAHEAAGDVTAANLWPVDTGPAYFRLSR